MSFAINKLTKPSNKKFESWYNEELQFGISIGEYCQVCHEEMTIDQGGYQGKPSLCLMCKVAEARDEKLTNLDI